MLKILGARVLGIRPELVLAATICENAYREIAGVDCIIRFVIDGKHRRASNHYTGCAFDLRMHNVPQDKRQAVVARIIDALDSDFDVIWEDRGTPNEHLHVQFVPKEPYK